MICTPSFHILKDNRIIYPINDTFLNRIEFIKERRNGNNKHWPSSIDYADFRTLSSAKFKIVVILYKG